MKFRFQLFSVCSLILLMSGLCFSDATVDEQCTRAVSSYEKALALSGQERMNLLAESRRLWQNLADSLPDELPNLHYNLGTVCLMQEDLGPAIYHLKRALQLNPSDPKIRRNLARAGVIGALETSPPEAKDWLTQLRILWAESSPWIWRLMFLFAALSGGVWLNLQARDWYRVSGKLCFSGVLLLATLLILHELGVGFMRQGVLLLATPAHRGPAESYPPAFVKDLPAGSVGWILKEDSGWTEVSFHAGRAWVSPEHWRALSSQ